MDNDTHGERCCGGVGRAVDWGRGGELQKKKRLKLQKKREKQEHLCNSGMNEECNDDTAKVLAALEANVALHCGVSDEVAERCRTG